MSKWGARHQLSYIFTILLILGLAVYGIYLYSFKPVPNCFDDLQNQNELGVDCGGLCEAVCSIETTNLKSLWARTFRVEQSEFGAVSYIENPNVFGLEEVNYTFKLYDKDNILVKEREGSTYSNPDERFAIVETNIITGNRVPVRAFFEFKNQSEWRRLGDVKKPKISIRQKKLELIPLPRVTATIYNDSLFDVGRVDASAVIFDSSDNVIGASKTFVNEIDTNESREVFFTWPEQFEGEASYFEIYTRTNLLAD